jgi:hypothetical protein
MGVLEGEGVEANYIHHVLERGGVFNRYQMPTFFVNKKCRGAGSFSHRYFSSEKFCNQA